MASHHTWFFVPYPEGLHTQLVAYAGELTLYVEAVVFEVGVDGYAYVHRELVDGFEDEGVASEGERMEVPYLVVEDDVENARLAEVEEVGATTAR